MAEGRGRRPPGRRPAEPAGWEPAIGLEVHAQLRTRTKIFCGCAIGFGAPPNERTCPVCLGHPGALPVLNDRAVELAVIAALALGATVRPRSTFARKNYFYPDLPKGYQITQYERPLAEGGSVEIETDGGPRRVGLARLHLEEDAGKLAHDPGGRHTAVDLNRAGTPLVEIVTHPDLRSPAEASAFLRHLRAILRAAGVCDGNMEEGSLRCDANVSVRRRGASGLGTRTELKNLNSFRNVQRALEHEIARQIACVEAGGAVERDTRAWDAGAGVTRSMRGKESEQDYRYFDDPDLPPLVVPAERVRELGERLPELPAARRRRWVGAWGIDERDAAQLALDPLLADYFEAVVAASGAPREAAHWILNDLRRERNRVGARPDDAIPIRPGHLVELMAMVEAGEVGRTAARQDLFGAMYDTGRAPRELAREGAVAEAADTAALELLVDEVIRAHPQQVAEYRAGKTGVLGWLVGRVRKASGGAADPRVVGELLRERLG